MNAQRLMSYLAVASLCLGGAACGGTTPFIGAQPFAIAGTPPPPPPPPPPAPEPPKPPPRVELRDNKIDFKEKIQFEVAKAIIKEESFSLLHDIAEVIKANPQVKKISIEGHASAEGDAKRNKKLSDDRAKSVMEHLVKKEGLDPARLAAKGWGVEKPIASNDDEAGREKNRRVEFLVVEQEVTQKKVEIDPSTGKEQIVEEKKELHKSPDFVEPPPDAKKAGADKAAEPKKLAGDKAAEPKKLAGDKAADGKKAASEKGKSEAAKPASGSDAKAAGSKKEEKK